MEKTILIIVINILLQFIVSAQPGISISVVTDKDTFLTLETIYIGASFKNNGGKVIKIEYPGIFFNTGIKIFNEAGENVEMLQVTITSVPFEKEVCLELQPDEEYFLVHNISDYIVDSLQWVGIGRLTPGAYTIELSYHLDNHIIKQKKKIFVSTPYFSEKIVYEKFLEILNRRINRVDLPPASIISAEELLTKYPNSVYSPFISVWCDIMSSFVNKTDKFANILLDTYPWSIYCRGYIIRQLKNLSMESEKIDILNKLKNKSEGKLMSRYYQKLINEVRSK